MLSQKGGLVTSRVSGAQNSKAALPKHSTKKAYLTNRQTKSSIRHESCLHTAASHNTKSQSIVTHRSSSFTTVKNNSTAVAENPKVANKTLKVTSTASSTTMTVPKGHHVIDLLS